MEFQNRVAVVTGAAGNIGQCICRELGKQGMTIILTDLDPERLAQVKSDFKQEGFKASAFVMDIANPESIKKASQKILETFGKIDILVNNAGYVKFYRFIETSDEEWDKIINTNLNGTFRVTRAFLDSMLQAGYGRIINIASIAGEVGLPGATAYSASKGGIILLTKTLAMELAKKNITVNSISPGWIGHEKRECPGTWIGRNGTGDEIARAVAFLASEEAGYITGIDMPVDGGRTLGPYNCHFE
ncbi:MAG: SDR family oxidoreductase [Victivallales bacterium]|nr:SDR family oxidoreductase [Victivallales bacterium]